MQHLSTVSANVLANAPGRIALAVAGALCAMLAIVLATRPEMASMSMKMVQNLFVGFGL